MSMDFQNVNLLNIRLNLLSGNLLPMTNLNSSFPFFWKIHSIFTWMLTTIMAILIIPGCIYVSIEKALKDGMICLAIFTEMSFMILRIHSRKDVVYELIRKLNEILHTADEAMKNVVTATLEPVRIPLNFYWSGGVASIIVWICMPLLLVFERNLFFYEDYRIPVVFSVQPFSFKIFLLGSLFLVIGSIFLFLKKVGVDVYMVHLILMMTAQYRYIATKIAIIFQEEYNSEIESQKKHLSGLDRRKEKKIKALCRHHNEIIYTTSLLKELLSLNFSLIYVISVFRFCFLGIMLSSITSTTFWEAILIVIYSSGAVVQLYILCSCVQQLLDASTEMTDKAFHEKWHLSQSSMKRIFILIIMANNLECKVATFEKFNLSLPSFMMILNQSYSIALLFLRVKS